ncbi:hypothetical protein PVAP13_7KG315706 [Panicum virgatum]|uniref:Uncharacterized protein n=1 Tax=Panicum virgatum TaxID=38727 RepID=A0A8T0QKI8_PANVG|nr:hypothetical protein PVAP13_7KG315706 [Panicum virgatum]
MLKQHILAGLLSWCSSADGSLRRRGRAGDASQHRQFVRQDQHCGGLWNWRAQDGVQRAGCCHAWMDDDGRVAVKPGGRGRAESGKAHRRRGETATGGWKIKRLRGIGRKAR